MIAHWDRPGTVLADLGIDAGQPGFYDDPAFLAAEQRDPSFLEIYAAFIQQKTFDTNYLSRAEGIVKRGVKYLGSRLAKENQVGRCIDASAVLMQFFERLGLWCYAVKGGMSLFFAPNTGLTPTRFAPLMRPGNPPAYTGHQWLCVPPYQVVDVAAGLQSYTARERKLISDFVLAKSLRPCRVEPFDLYEPEAIALHVQQTGAPPTLHDAEAACPGILATIEAMKPGEVRRGKVTFRYVGTGTTAPADKLEDWKNLTIEGKYPIDFLDDFMAEVDR